MDALAELHFEERVWVHTILYDAGYVLIAKGERSPDWYNSGFWFVQRIGIFKIPIAPHALDAPQWV